MLTNIFGNMFTYKEGEDNPDAVCPLDVDDRNSKRVAGVADFRPVKPDDVLMDIDEFTCN